MMLHEFQVFEEQVNNFRDNNIGLYGVDISRVSWLLSVQLYCALKHRSFNIFSVTDVIQQIEGRRPSRLAKGPEEFKHPPLKGLWKAHFFDPRFMVRNLINEWGLIYESSQKFKDLCERAAKEEEAEPSKVGSQGRLAHAVVVEGYESRASKKKLTGEWIIFGKHEGKNYYLCIATHSSTRKEDEEIYNAVQHLCSDEFPFLFEHTA